MFACLEGTPRMHSPVVETLGEVNWSLDVRFTDGRALLRSGEARQLRTASVPKLLLLAELARQMEAGTVDPAEDLSRQSIPAVADSGIWQFMKARTLSAWDAAVLVGAVSDNLATNVLVNRIGLDRIRQTAVELGCHSTELLDVVRDHRDQADPPTVSRGSAVELAGVVAALHRGELISNYVSETVKLWLTIGTDLSMVGAAFGLDPLAHVGTDRGLSFFNKTGCDLGVRADTGVVGLRGRAIAYACIANWSEEPGSDLRDRVLRDMRALGTWILAALTYDHPVGVQMLGP